MFKNTSKKKSTLVSVVAMAVALFALASSRPAQAAGINGAASQVELNAGSSSNPVLMLQLNGNGTINYLAQQTSPCSGVPSLSADTVKMFLSLAQAAVLAGKNITIYYNTCSGSTTPYIYDIVLAK